MLLLGKSVTYVVCFFNELMSLLDDLKHLFIEFLQAGIHTLHRNISRVGFHSISNLTF